MRLNRYVLFFAVIGVFVLWWWMRVPPVETVIDTITETHEQSMNERATTPTPASTSQTETEQVYKAPQESASIMGYKEVFTTFFWVGEAAEAENGFIANDDSYWDTRWVEHFGGIDDPTCRSGYYPCDFVPGENPFYVALPYGEYVEGTRTLKASAKSIPWYDPASSEPLLKNRWVEVIYRGKTCYGQWQDVGPYLTDDYAYVFGTAAPSNTFGVEAGLDVSPALWDCLGLNTNATTQWRFVEAGMVPEGPWKEIVTTSRVSSGRW